MANDAPHFEVHPSVVYQLGESLITDAVQALIELVKNCYDADATYAKVIIDTAGAIDVPGAFYPADGGRILVEDDGHGMTLDDIDTGWLTISNRKKQEFKLARRLTDRGRTPLGDKGLGRLGVQRLGQRLEIFTKAKNEGGIHFGFCWSDFANKAHLQDVTVQLDDWAATKTPGTRIVVSGLCEVDAWRGEEAIGRLQRELSQMISPFKQIRDFVVIVEVDGKAIALQEITDKVRDIAPIRYALHFDGTSLEVTGRARLAFFCPPTRKDAEDFALIAEGDNGAALYAFLQEHKVAKAIGLTKGKTSDWFVAFHWTKRLEDVVGVEHVSDTASPVANPGPFSGEVDAFDLGSTSFDRQSIFDRISVFRDQIKKSSGIRVFRDGFAIRVDHDWLKLGSQWTSASSYYGLKPNNTLGYIALSARDNMDLEETTNREEFKDSPYYRNFYSLLRAFTTFTEMAQEFFGRSWTGFRNKRAEQLAQVDSRKTVEDISRQIKDGLAQAGAHQGDLAALRGRLQTSVRASQAVSARLQAADDVSPRLRAEISNALAALEPVLAEAQATTGRISQYLGELGTLHHVGEVLQNRVDGLREQMDCMYETVALGLTAEALSHEVFNIADQLAARTRKALDHVRRVQLADRTILNLIEYVKSAGMALRKQMSYLSPELRYVREQRDDIDVMAFLGELADFHRSRLAGHHIHIAVECGTGGPLHIRMNRGKLTQIIDNFVLNSEYWLREDIAQGRLKDGRIILEVDRPFVRIADTGRGVDPNIEGALFEPFVSAKGRGRGRGLGLFIVKQLVDSEACSVGLLPQRNTYKRLFKFQIDFRGATHE